MRRMSWGSPRCNVGARLGTRRDACKACPDGSPDTRVCSGRASRRALAFPRSRANSKGEGARVAGEPLWGPSCQGGWLGPREVGLGPTLQL